jgi:uncharacterized protein with ParB-like and HNH nuclease domain
MKAGTLSVKDLFGSDRRYVVPLFQRPYVWSESNQWDPLWTDILRLASQIYDGESHIRPHFLGAIVLDQLPHPTGHLEARQVVDGQQRLTTLQILLEAFADICQKASAGPYDRALLKLTRNDDPISKDPDDEFKVWPTNADRDSFRIVMKAATPSAVLKAFDQKSQAERVGHPIGDAYLFFYSQIHEWLHQEPKGLMERIEALYYAVREHIRVVAIDLTKEDDPQVIFETLNARGTPLLPADLIKNLLFYHAQSQGAQLEQLYEKYWAPFDQGAKYWRREVGRGHARRPRLDTYLMHYLTMKTMREVPASHIYVAYQDYANDGVKEGVESELRDLRRYAATYREFENEDLETRDGLFFHRLNIMNITTAYPFLLKLCESETKKQIIGKVLHALESYLIRRMICRLSTRGYNLLFIDIIKSWEKEHHSAVSNIASFLKRFEGEDRRWPEDAEFEAAWMTRPAYTVMSQARIRMILEALEADLRSKKSEKIKFGDKLTIEHLLPREWKRYYPLPKRKRPEIAEVEREEVIHTFGNLTLLTSSLNPAVSNGPWKRKRKEILRHSALALNRALGEEQEWNEVSIRKRGKRLFTIARRMWPAADAFC